MRRVLVSGFEPFAGMDGNPSQDVVLDLKNKNLSGFQLDTIILPVSFENSFTELHRKMELFQPEIVLATGLARKRQHLSIERVAVNLMDASLPDNEGFQPEDLPICPGGTQGLFCELPLKSMLKACLDAQVSAVISNTAGTYVCNQVMYRLCELSRRTGIKAGFIHLPSFEFVPKDQQVLALMKMIEVL